METAIIIPNFNGQEMLRACLNSLEAQTYQDFGVFVVDNGSRDGSVAMLREKFPRTQVIALKENTGFARGTNIGIRDALQRFGQELKYICPLNNDIELDPDYLMHLVKAAQKYQEWQVRLGILAAKLYFKEEPHLINSTGTVVQLDGSGMERGFRHPDSEEFQTPAEIFGSCGAAALYTKQMLTEVAYLNQAGETCYFDEDFFAYYEDLDLNYRSRLLGYRAFFVPTAIGYHLHSATGRSFSSFKSFHVHRNQYYVLFKNFPLPYLILGLFFLPIRYIMLTLSVLLGRGPAAELKKNTTKEKAGSSATLTKEEAKFKGKGPVGLTLAALEDVFKNRAQLLKKRSQIQGKRAVSLGEFGRWLKEYRADLKQMIFKT